MVDIDKCVLKVFELLHIDKIDKGAISLYSIFTLCLVLGLGVGNLQIWL